MLEAGQDIFDVATNLRQHGDLLPPRINISLVVRVGNQRRVVPIIGHVQDRFLRSNGDFLEDSLASEFANVMTNHDAMCLDSLVSNGEGLPASFGNALQGE